MSRRELWLAGIGNEALRAFYDELDTVYDPNEPTLRAGNTIEHVRTAAVFIGLVIALTASQLQDEQTVDEPRV